MCFSEYFQAATAIDPLKLFPKTARRSADALAQEQALQENMGDRDTRPGSRYHAKASITSAASHSLSSTKVGTPSTVEMPTEIGDIQSESSDDVRE